MQKWQGWCNFTAHKIVASLANLNYAQLETQIKLYCEWLWKEAMAPVGNLINILRLYITTLELYLTRKYSILQL